MGNCFPVKRKHSTIYNYEEKSDINGNDIESIHNYNDEESLHNYIECEIALISDSFKSRYSVDKIKLILSDEWWNKKTGIPMCKNGYGIQWDEWLKEKGY